MGTDPETLQKVTEATKREKSGESLLALRYLCDPSFKLSFRAVRGISEIEIAKNNRDSSHGSE
jgi:hypothetical protein